MGRDIIINHCKYCLKQIEKNKKYCNYSCGKLYRRHGLNKIDFEKFDLKRRIKNCEVCDKLFIDNTRSLCALHCSLSCQNFKYYHSNRDHHIQRAREYRLNNPNKVKATNRKSRMKNRDRHKAYMKEWHNIRKMLNLGNKE